jgi:hypothetical protein
VMKASEHDLMLPPWLVEARSRNLCTGLVGERVFE